MTAAALSERSSAAPSPALEVRGLRVRHEWLGTLIDDVSLRIDPGEVLALVGESGCGKSLTALSLMRLLPGGFEIAGGSVRLGAHDLLARRERDLNRIRGRRIAMLFQQPQAMLDPSATVGAQIAEPLRLHLGMSRADTRRRVVELLGEVGIAEPAHVAASYGFQLSGGMAQRAMTAMALAANPDVLVADEPTTALDVTVQLQILELLHRLRRQRGLAVLLITHDLGVVSALADRVAVMYAGRILEQGTVDAVLERPRHPYTQVLVECSLLRERRDGSLLRATSSVPEGIAQNEGCRYFPRCPTATRSAFEGACRSREPTLAVDADGMGTRCWAVNPPDDTAP